MNATANGEAPQQNGFQVRLTNFEGPFDLLLQLIFAHRLDVTEVALHQVTDDFIAYTREIGPQLELEETTAFLVVAATLLDLKAARLLPAGQVDDDEDLALLEVRDLLFARLLQYRAFKHVAEMFAELEATALRSYPRAVSLEDRFTELLPEVMIGVDADRFARSRRSRSARGPSRRCRWRTCTRCRSPSPSRPRSCWRSFRRGAAGRGRRSPSWSPIVRRRWRWSGGSWRCSNCIGRGR